MTEEIPATARTCRVAVVGAGAAGLTAVKELAEAGLEVVAYERRERPGGLWVRDPRGSASPAYASLHLNTSKGRTEFAAHPMPAGWPDYPSADLVAGYLDDYARRFGLYESIRFGVEVTRVERGPDGWLVTADGATERYDAVVVANGHNWDPRRPDPAYPGEFSGEQMHAHDYQDADVFAGRRVLVVGMGNSAVDIAVDASHRARGPVLLSSRQGVYVIPKYLFGKPADATNGALSRLPWRLRQRISEAALRLATGRPEAYGLPAPERGLLESHPTVSDTLLHRLTHGEVEHRPGIERFDGGQVVFTDGRRDTVDLVVWATGYRVTVPFLDERWLGPDPEDLLLYHRVFHLQDPTLCFVGLMQSTGAAFPVVEAQSRLAADVLSGRASLPTAEEQRADAERALKASVERWGGDRRPAMRIDFDGYMAETAAVRRAAAERARAGQGVRVRAAAPQTIGGER
jgi:NADPH-dependent 2,4-dienoyl-CoA reductase/sulfur reductase-like enzyme